MPANTSPIFLLTPNLGASNYGTAEPTTRNGTPTNKSTIFTAGSAGSLVYLVTYAAAVTTTAGEWRVWKYDGANYFMMTERTISAVTVSATQKGFQDEWRPTVPIPLKTGETLVWTTEIANAANVLAYGGDF